MTEQCHRGVEHSHWSPGNDLYLDADGAYKTYMYVKTHCAGHFKICAFIVCEL